MPGNYAYRYHGRGGRGTTVTLSELGQADQAQRLFGSIMAGGSLGAIMGPLLTANQVVQSVPEGS